MKRLTFVPQLDSFRFFAVAFVMFSHWLPAYEYLPWGQYGVVFFFVLSGYLISSNLMYLKQSIDNREITLPGALKVFYLRRVLRIFPLYYLVLTLLFLFAPMRLFLGNIGWYFLYLPNFLMFRTKLWPGPMSHFWSLGVEEQFYFIWPLLIFLVKWRWLKRLFVAFVAFSVGYKAIVFLLHGSSFHEVLPWSNFDAFGIGALLAYSPFAPGQLSRLKKVLTAPGFLVCAAASVACCFFLPFLIGFFISAAAYFLIRKAQVKFKGLAGWVLDLPAIQYLGRISYGLYVYHQAGPWLWRCLTGKETLYPLPIALLRGAWTGNAVVTLAAEFLITVLIATVSWYVVEQPFIHLKHRLQPKPRPAMAA